MASRITQSVEILGIVLVLVVFVFLIGKYYLPTWIYAQSERAVASISIPIRHGLYAALAFVDSDIRNGATTTEKAVSVPALLYHGLPLFSNEEVTSTQFREQMFELKRAGWETITLEDMFAFQRGERELPDKSFLLTFDDGIRSSYRSAQPVLEALDYTAVMFIITQYSTAEGSSYYLSVDEVRDMLESEHWEIQSHGHDAHGPIVINAEGDLGRFNASLRWLPEQNRLETVEEFRERLRKDFEVSKEKIEALGVTSTAYAFPFGEFGQNSDNLPDAQNIVLEIASSIYPSVTLFQFWPSTGFTFNYPLDIPESPMIRRITVSPEWSADDLLTQLERGGAKSLPYEDTKFTTQSGWVPIFGDYVLEEPSGMTISANANTTGGLAFFDGSRQWQDYTVAADLIVEKGISASIAVRYRDVNNYVLCVIEPHVVFIQSFVNGEERTIERILTGGSAFEIETPFTMHVSVEGDTVACGTDEFSVSSVVPATDMSATGGIGLKTWDPEIDNSSVRFNRLTVEGVTAAATSSLQETF